MKIAFVAHNAFGAVAGGSHGHVGGVEKQTALMARWLARRGHSVSVLTWDEGPAGGDAFEGVRVVRMCRKDAGLPVLRFFWPRWTSLLAGMRAADADVYYQNGAEHITGQVAAWCARHRRRFVFSVASDMDVDRDVSILPSPRDRAFFRYGLARADLLIAQTPAQKAAIDANFGRTSTVLPLPCEGPSESDYQPPAPEVREPLTVLWVGRIAPVKRLELLVEIASACPDIRFIVAGKPDGDPGYAGPVLASIGRLGNVEYLGAVARADMPALYRRAALLLCTSHYEGFPNTFLEAWSHGVPVVSTIDPADLLETGGLGARCAHDAGSAVAALRSFQGNEVRWRESSERCREHFVRHHSLDNAMGRFEAAMSQLASRDHSRTK